MDLLIEVPAPARRSPGRMLNAARVVPYMLETRWERDRGWSDVRITRLAPWRLSPFTAVFHYAQAIFEGLKARRATGGVAVFQLRAHAARFADSARRMAMPVLPENDFCACVIAFVRHQKAQFRDGEAFYLRPVMFASEEILGARPAASYTFAILGAVVAEPVGLRGLRVLVDPRYTRAAPGGTGAAKTAGNYAAALLAQAQAAERGYHQVLFLDSCRRTYVEETGSANVIFVQGNTLLTPPPSETILDGITRRSVLALAPALGLRVEERPLLWPDLYADMASGRIIEAFGVSTAAGVLPMAHLGTEEEGVDFGDGDVGPRLQAALRDEQFGRGLNPAWLTIVT